MNGFTLLILSTFSSALASVCLKINSITLDKKIGFFFSIINIWTALGLFFYGFAFFCYIFLLKKIPLSLAQPTITAGTSTITVILAMSFFNENLSFFNFLGLIFIFVGIFFLFMGKV